MSHVDNLAEHIRLKNARLVRDYLVKHGCETDVLFATAYLDYFGVIDYYEIRSNIDRYRITEDPPPYVRWFLTQPRN